jgi:hypothetical protein
MYVRVDLEPDIASVSLEEPENCKQFHVVLAGVGSDTVVANALEGAGVGRASPKPGHVYVNVDAVRSMAAGRVGDGWDDEFSGMLGYASSKGWLDGTGSAIEAHIERG